MLNRRVNKVANIRVGFHRHLYVIDKLVELRIVDQVLSKM